MLWKYSPRWVLLLGTVFLITTITRAGEPRNAGLSGPTDGHSRQNSGGGQVKAIAVLDGSLHQIQKDSSVTVEDSAFFNPSYTGDLDTSYSVQNRVTLMINEATNLYLRTAFSVTVKLKISYTTGPGPSDTASTIRSLTIGYDSLHTYNSRASFIFSGAHKVTVTVISDSSNVTTWDPSTVLVLENQLITHPNFIFKCSNTVGNITISPSADPTADELPVTWTTVLGADQYDLEWTYIDSSALVDTNSLGVKKYGNPLNPVLIFRNNATRVSTTGTSYNIPLIYDNTGTLFIRVRPVQLGKAGSVTTATWSSEAATPVMGQYTFRGHERPLNWQSNISFAEEGKRKVVVQYYDGSLRSRQTVTKDNTTNTTIVGETYYDYQGRPAIQVMPSPTLSTIIKYTAAFNVSINGQEYSQSNYDTLPNPGAFCSIHADPMIDTAGASLYYSPLNPAVTTALNQFIPNAHNYPFTETEYTPDNTGRINRQGGVDSLYQLGNGHETKYFYGTPDQNELDGLFGTEVGNKSHYFKNMVRDANGQYSVSYVDMHGRTIATALAGATPPGLAALSSNTTTKVTETLIDSNSVFFQDLSMVSQKSLLVARADTFQFNYRFTPATLHELNCQQQNICYTCRYDLEISITDNCNNQLLGGQPFDTVKHNFSLSSLASSCTDPDMNLSFSLILPEGSYMITKKLTVNKDVYNFYRDSIYLPNNTCTTIGQFITQQKAIAASANPSCAPSCDACLAGVGTWASFWANYQAQAGPGADSLEADAAFKNALSSCSVLCKNTQSDDNDILNAMLQDVSPPFGQYADTLLAAGADKYSIFFIKPGDALDSANYTPIFKLPAVHYLDANGKPDSVYNEESGIMVAPNSLTTSQFVQNFRPSWANALLPYHPEYCKLQVLQAPAQRTSNLWDRKMEAVDTYQEALDSGFLNPTGNSTWAFTIDSYNIDPLSQESTALKNSLEDRLRNFQKITSPVNVTMSMWGIACSMVKCDSGDIACMKNFSNVSGNPPLSTFSALSCSGDQDMAWKNFRELYLGAKQTILNQLIVTNAGSCTPANNRVYTKEPKTTDIISANHQPEFSDAATTVGTNISIKNLRSVSGPTQAANQKTMIQDSLNVFYTATANAYIQQWKQQLSVCSLYYTAYDTAALTHITAGLDSLCRKACDSAHPFGASSLPPGVTIMVDGQSCNSFQDIINHYNTAHSITADQHCNAELITAPLPYNNQPVYSNKPVYSRPSDCECSLINDLYNRYTVAGHGDASFAAWLLRTQQITMSDADLAQLRTMCSNTTNSATCKNLSKPIFLPAAMQCNVGSTCSACQSIDSLYTLFRTQYPSDTPSISTDADTAQAQKNILFQNFMNNRLGYNKQAWEYLQFMDTCVAHAADTVVTSSCVPTTIAQLFNSNGKDTMTDIHSTPDGGYILSGKTKAAGASDIDAYLIRYNKTGEVQWAKRYGSPYDDDFNRVRSTSDNGFIAVGTTYAGGTFAGSVLVVKTDAAGTVLWQKAMGFGSSSAGEKGFDIVQTKDGGYAVVGDHGIDHSNTGAAGALVMKLDSVGNVKWTKQIYITGSNDGYGVRESPGTSGAPDTLLVVGRYYDGPNFNGYIYKLQEDTGAVLNSYFFEDANNLSVSTSEIFPTPYGYGVTAYSHSGSSATSGRALWMELNYNGTIRSTIKIGAPSGLSSTDPITGLRIIPTLDSGFLVGESASLPAVTNIYWEKFNSNNVQTWSRQTGLHDRQAMGAVIQNADSTYAVLGTDSSIAMLLNLTDSGTAACYDIPVTLGSISYTIGAPVPLPSPTIHTDGPSVITSPLVTSVVTITFIPITCNNGTSCYSIYNGPLLCGKSAPLLPPVAIDSITTCSDSTFFSVSKGTGLFNTYSDSLTGDFEQRYKDSCMQAYKYETFTVTHNNNEYHYTLYYYDQAGNLVKTVPPAGVQQITDTNELKQIRAARAAGTVKTPAHTLVTDYRYNTLNRVVAQHSPDGSTSNFWYDRLGRLALSQNGRQQPNNQYSYTQYDSIGRIVQVGQLVSGTAITDAISRTEATLLQWENNVASSANQITVTTYDTAAFAIIPELAPRNLRNRVAWTALYDTAFLLSRDSANAATYYSYDILGNVDTLVQDYNIGSMGANGNRFKKIVYDFDLVSGKVNQVTYQHGYADAFYHSYLYDAENRITNVQSSTDSINWDNDAFYSYYAHGPLARTVLGEQQVQGINYAYTLQGWLKAINPAPYIGGSFTLRPDSSNNIVAASAYNILLNYHDRDYTPISGVAGPDSAVSTSLSGDYRPLFNGNISSMGVNVRNLSSPLLYNYQYDQLNRLVHMDAWKRTSTPWSAITKHFDYQESIAYDPNGNIQKYKRNGDTAFGGPSLDMDNMVYSYIPGTNKLDHINDSVTSLYTNDIKDQSSGNYKYDSVGELVSDSASNITNITWTVYGKIASITKGGDTTILYTYDAGGNRISKSVVHAGETQTTWYVRDAQGNVLSVYTYGDPAVKGKDLTQTELDVYGSSRLGILKTAVDVEGAAPVTKSLWPPIGMADSLIFTRGNKLFELTNHLNNVLSTISDKRYGVSPNDSTVTYFIPDVVSANDYYPFGSLQPDRSYPANGSGYRYGFNGKEKDDEVKGNGDQIDYGMRVYDPRVGRFLSVDPLVSKYPDLTPFQFASNTPIWAIDLDGLEESRSWGAKIREWYFQHAMFWMQPIAEGIVGVQKGLDNADKRIHYYKDVIKNSPTFIKQGAQAIKEAIEIRIDYYNSLPPESQNKLLHKAVDDIILNSTTEEIPGLAQVIEEEIATTEAHNAFLYEQYKKDLAAEELNSLFNPEGSLKVDIVKESEAIIEGKDLNKELIKDLTSDGSKIDDWNKMSYEITQETKAGKKTIDIHYYYNKKTGKLYFDKDYKSKLPANYFDQTPPNPNPPVKPKPAAQGSNSRKATSTSNTTDNSNP